METTPSPLGFIERFNNWIRESIMIKLFSIGFLIIVLLIPANLIEELIQERHSRADEAVREITSKWSADQRVTGPILVIPYKKWKPSLAPGGAPMETIAKAYFLPEELAINAAIDPELRHRGIFDAVVYTSKIELTSTFVKPNFTTLGIRDEDIRWTDAHLVVGINDLRGISDNPSLLIGPIPHQAEPTSDIGLSADDEDVKQTSESTYLVDDPRKIPGIVTKLNWSGPENFQEKMALKISLRGSDRIAFTPTGKTTDVKVSGRWGSPSFDGSFLPKATNITDTAFDASWKILHFNRPFSQQWVQSKKSGEALEGADFGVSLFIPADQYQQTTRTAKYAILMILLTFMSLFLVEITQKVRIHPFQYILIAAALIIYYTLLLSFSEQMGYYIAYIIASISTIALIGFYSKSFLHGKLSVLLSGLLAIFYAFIFVIIFEQDYSLLIGSIGLFTIVAMLMYFSRKVKWYDEKKSPVVEA
ncbi:cell envelope integrity protein CreD [Pseudochryseolinea flava]|uniref:Cell envelope integrity protein CreD n=1 Tax=Pseudochryseolinea flava TaxID=2059302 RepID=A0A364Y1W1_9BACT|nr:cell envelope integrity protein CreD [Pseudochryseolinea flava]RAW00647.1 cell envelope integrity protein CreD [Pseudochryseolinea flava]